MKKSSSDKIIEKVVKLLPDTLREYDKKMIDKHMLDIVENKVTRFLQSTMREEGYDLHKYIRVEVEQDKKDLTKVRLHLLPTSLEGIEFLDRLEEKYSE